MNRTEDLIERARTIYERARLLKALRTAAFALPLMLISFGCCRTPSVSIAIAGALALLVTVLVRRGGSPARAVVPGYAAGMVPFAIPLLACPLCASLGIAGVVQLAVTVIGGVASGAIVVYYAAREQEDRTAFVLAGGAVAALAGSLGCVIAGLSGVLAMIVGLAVVTPLAFRGARAT
ncbi:MAG TPA: hypothetical protein VNO21_13095 [Polyangiaceae bacterium]|nr:hypothetical protein [Polyangiaceae bacterium]